MTINKIALAAAATLGALTAGSANAEVITLNFTGIATTGNNTPAINDFYNGGTSAAGTSGVNYGVSFSSNALAINSYNGANEPNPGILFFLSGTNVFVNYAAGFDTGFSFFYATNGAGTATAYTGLNGTGTALGTIALTTNFVANCGYCTWTSSGVNFAGIARSIGFTGVANNAGFDQLTFGSANAGAVPEPASWAMMILGVGAVGGALRRRAKVSTTVRFA